MVRLLEVLNNLTYILYYGRNNHIRRFKEQEVQFADQVRFFRNGILYYGTVLDKEYAEKVIEFTKINYLRLKEIIKVK